MMRENLHQIPYFELFRLNYISQYYDTAPRHNLETPSSSSLSKQHLKAVFTREMWDNGSFPLFPWIFEELIYFFPQNWSSQNINNDIPLPRLNLRWYHHPPHTNTADWAGEMMFSFLLITFFSVACLGPLPSLPCHIFLHSWFVIFAALLLLCMVADDDCMRIPSKTSRKKALEERRAEESWGERQWQILLRLRLGMWCLM